jgi:hypothetical protein
MKVSSLASGIIDLRDIAEIKTEILNVAHQLVNDSIVTREQAARRLLALIPGINNLEADLYHSLEKEKSPTESRQEP